MKVLTLLGMIVLITATVAASRDRLKQKFQTLDSRLNHMNFENDQTQHWRRKRDTRQNSPDESPAILGIPKDTITKYLHEAVAHINAAKGAGNQNSPTVFVTEYVLKKLIENDLVDESKRDEFETELMSALKDNKFGDHVDEILKHFDSSASGYRHLHRSNAAEQQPGNHQSFKKHHKTSSHKSNRHHGKHKLPTLHHNPRKQSGQQLHHKTGPNHVTVPHQTTGHGPHDNGTLHKPVLTLESVKEHVSHVMEGVKDMDDQAEAYSLLQQFSIELKGLEKHIKRQHVDHAAHVKAKVITKDDVKQRVIKVVDSIAAAGDASDIQSTLKTLVHIIRSFEVFQLDPSGEHMKSTGDSGDETEDPLQFTMEYVKDYAFEVIDKLGAFHNAEEVEMALHELYQTLMLVNQSAHHNQHHFNINMTFVRKFASKVFDHIQHNPDKSEASVALNIISHTLYSIRLGMGELDQTTEGLHEHHEHASFKDKLNKVKFATFELLAVVEANLKGDKLHWTLSQIFHLFGMVGMSVVKTEHPDQPQSAPHKETLDHLTPESVLLHAYRIIDESASQGKEEELSMVLHKITLFLHKIEAKFTNYRPHRNSAHHAHQTSQHATPDSVKAMAVEVVDDLVTRYHGHDLQRLLGQMMHYLENIKHHGLNHTGISHHGSPQGEWHLGLGAVLNGQGEGHNRQEGHHGQGEGPHTPSPMHHKREKKHPGNVKDGQHRHGDFINRHHKAAVGTSHQPRQSDHALSHLPRQSDHPVHHQPTRHVPLEHQRKQQERHFENNQQLSEGVINGHDTQVEQDIPGVHTEENVAVQPLSDVKGAIPSSTNTGNDDQMLPDTLQGDVSAAVPSITNSGNDDKMLPDTLQGDVSAAVLSSINSGSDDQMLADTPQGDVSAAVPSRTYSGGDDHMLPDTKRDFDAYGTHARFTKRK